MSSVQYYRDIVESAETLEALVKSGRRDSEVVREFIELIHWLSEAGVLDSENNNIQGAVDLLYSAFGQIGDDDLADLRYYHKLSDQDLAKVVHDEIEGHKDQILTACADLVSEFDIVPEQIIDDACASTIPDATSFIRLHFGVVANERRSLDEIVVKGFQQCVESPSTIDLVVKELRHRIANMNESEARKWLLDECGCQYDYPFHGLTSIQWMQRLVRLLTQQSDYSEWNE